MIPTFGTVLKTRFTGKDSNTLKEFVKVIFETAVTQWFMGAAILFAGVSLLVSLAMQNFWPDLAGDPTFSAKFPP